MAFQFDWKVALVSQTFYENRVLLFTAIRSGLATGSESITVLIVIVILTT